MYRKQETVTWSDRQEGAGVAQWHLIKFIKVFVICKIFLLYHLLAVNPVCVGKGWGKKRGVGLSVYGPTTLFSHSLPGPTYTWTFATTGSNTHPIRPYPLAGGQPLLCGVGCVWGRGMIRVPLTIVGHTSTSSANSANSASSTNS